MLHKEIKMQPCAGEAPSQAGSGAQGAHITPSVAVSSCASKNGYPSASQAVSHREMGRGCPPGTRGVLQVQGCVPALLCIMPQAPPRPKQGLEQVGEGQGPTQKEWWGLGTQLSSTCPP